VLLLVRAQRLPCVLGIHSGMFDVLTSSKVFTLWQGDPLLI